MLLIYFQLPLQSRSRLRQKLLTSYVNAQTKNCDICYDTLTGVTAGFQDSPEAEKQNIPPIISKQYRHSKMFFFSFN